MNRVNDVVLGGAFGLIVLTVLAFPSTFTLLLALLIGSMLTLAVLHRFGDGRAVEGAMAWGARTALAVPTAAQESLDGVVAYLDERRAAGREAVANGNWFGTSVVWAAVTTPVWLFMLLLLKTLDTDAFLVLGFSDVVASSMGWVAVTVGSMAGLVALEALGKTKVMPFSLADGPGARWWVRISICIFVLAALLQGYLGWMRAESAALSEAVIQYQDLQEFGDIGGGSQILELEAQDAGTRRAAGRIVGFAIPVALAFVEALLASGPIILLELGLIAVVAAVAWFIRLLRFPFTLLTRVLEALFQFAVAAVRMLAGSTEPPQVEGDAALASPDQVVAPEAIEDSSELARVDEPGTANPARPGDPPAPGSERSEEDAFERELEVSTARWDGI